MEMKAKEKKLQSFRTIVSLTFETKSREKKNTGKKKLPNENMLESFWGQT